MRQAFAADPGLGIISFRIADPDTGVTQRRHVPRLRAADPMRSSRVTTFLGGANAVRTKVLAEVGGLPDEFFYAHEETDLAWRALDAGWAIDYRADMVLHHPTTAPPGTRSTTAWSPATASGSPAATCPRRSSRSTSASGCCSPWPAGPPRPALRAWLGGFREGWTTPVRPPAAHEVAYGMAADPTGPPSRDLTSSCLRASASYPDLSASLRPHQLRM